MASYESGGEYCQDEVFSKDVFFKRLNHMNADLAQFVGRAPVRDDLDLVHATQGGDLSAFEELVERYDRKLLRNAEHITHNREDSLVGRSEAHSADGQRPNSDANPPIFSRVGEYFPGEVVLDSSWATQQGDRQTGKIGAQDVRGKNHSCLGSLYV